MNRFREFNDRELRFLLGCMSLNTHTTKERELRNELQDEIFNRTVDDEFEREFTAASDSYQMSISGYGCGGRDTEPSRNEIFEEARKTAKMYFTYQVNIRRFVNFFYPKPRGAFRRLGI